LPQISHELAINLKTSLSDWNGGSYEGILSSNLQASSIAEFDEVQKWW
jgi:hypothetical protein